MIRKTEADHVGYLIFTTAAMFCAVTAFASPNTLHSEPNVEVASAWWPEMENTWVPIGWKDHPLRFNVLYNGTLIAQPVRYPARGQGVQLTFLLSGDGEPPVSVSTPPYQLRSRDGGIGDQGWRNNATPILWTCRRQDGVVLRQGVFAHLKGGGPVKTGAEPLFAWIRLSVGNSQSTDAFVLIRVNRPHIETAMDRHKNLIADHSLPARVPYRQERPARVEVAAPGARRHHVRRDRGPARGHQRLHCRHLPPFQARLQFPSRLRLLAVDSLHAKNVLQDFPDVASQLRGKLEKHLGIEIPPLQV